MKNVLLALLAVCAAWVPLAAFAQNAAVLRADTLRAEPYADAKPVAEVPAGAKLRLIERKGTWANAEYQGRRGWMRALNLKADGAAAIKAEGVLALQTGRAAQGGGVAVPLAVRAARPPRHAQMLLEDVFEHRDASRALNFSARLAAPGELELALDSPRAGFAHVFAVDSTGRVLRCLFPSASNPDNEIAAARALTIAGVRLDPAEKGTVRLLALVADAPPDLMFEDKESDGPYFRLTVTEENRPRIAQALAAGVYSARTSSLPAARP